MIKENFNLSYDISGNLILTIPKSYINNTDINLLLKSVENLMKTSAQKINSSNNWSNDSAADIVGLCQSQTNNGSVCCDKHIYGL